MLHSLYIKDYTLVEELSIRFDQGLNIITGESGAGKSILVNAIAQLCGERGSSDLVRTGAKQAIIEAQFSIAPTPDLRQTLVDLALEIEDFADIIIRKEILSTGKSRIFVNDSPITLNLLNAFSPFLLDLHGQHQHQRLLHPENHAAYLDAFGRYEKDLVRFRNQFKDYQLKSRELDDLKSRQREAIQKRDMYRYQYQELSKADLREDELDELHAELVILNNVELLFQSGERVSAALYSGDANASSALIMAEDGLAQLEKLDQKFSGLLDNLRGARETVEEIGRFTEQYLSELEFSPERMELIHQRTAQLEFLLKKYQQSDLKGLIALHSEMNDLLNQSEQFDEVIEREQKQLTQMIQEINRAGLELSKKRKVTALQFEKAISQILIQLGMPQAKFRVRLDQDRDEGSPFSYSGNPAKADRTGFDQIIFEILSNQGESFKAIHKIASGGEISRLMLALKTVLAEADQISTLVFDEIDSGISGKIAQIVGLKLQELSQLHQILCVTHLPQIAAFSANHFKVSKQVQNGRTLIQMQALTPQQRERELANLLGGKGLSEQALENARHLIREAQEA